ncbi:germ cell nuclear acidic protein-like [Condylostylus longicornis]|uniref:germ cell nuclear acidic protein-like n=1 Tax=Condylostylus longicornis TaxID=2530218 RepID=UPI00244DABA4|nr:germ cell nuclear acidic protein-like [Condylostylus longicornis]
MDYLYGLLDSEEFYRIPSNIKERFAKLTLSKKKQLRKSLEANLIQKEKSNECKELSKNILREILTDDSSESEFEELNKIFESSNSNFNTDKNISNRIPYKPKKLSEIFNQLTTSDSDETHCSAIENIEKKEKEVIRPAQYNITEDMEKLEFSIENESNANENLLIDVLSQKVNSLGICSPRKSQTEQICEKTQLISVESERKSLNDLDTIKSFPPLKIENGTQKHIALAETEPNTDLIFGNYNKTSAAVISLSSEESGEKSEDLTSDSEDLNDYNIIVVSDSDTSISSLGQPPKKSSDVTENYSDQISDIKASGQTFLPDTLSNAKADRLEAFLNDLPAPNEFCGINNIENSILAKSTDESNLYDTLSVEESVEISGTSTENEIKDSILKKNEEILISPIQQEESFIQKNFPNTSSSSNFPEKNNLNPDKEFCRNTSQNEKSSGSSNYEYEEISVSAKFNIKIHINSQPNIIIDQKEETYTSGNCNESPKTQTSRQSEVYQENLKAIAPASIVETLSESDKKNISVDNIDVKAKKILTKLYGNQWQTPENIKKLDKTINSKSKDDSKYQNDENHLIFPKNAITLAKNKDAEFMPDKYHKTESKIFKLPPKVAKPVLNGNSKVEKFACEEPRITDFSLFHKNVRNDFESTRLNIANSPDKEGKILKQKLPLTEAKKKNKSNLNLDIPQTEKIKTTAIATRSGRQIKPVQWKNLLDMDSSSDQWSDDSQADATYKTLSSTKSDGISSDSILSSNDSDISGNRLPSRSKKKSKRRDAGKKKSSDNDKITYLDLSQEVVKVQTEYKSPPAKNDPRFNEKLDSLLKSCTFEPRKQLEATPTIRRKLFNPNFGDENEIIPPNSPLRPLQNDSQDIKLSIPLSSLFGMPINKKLESVKTGTPIFKIPSTSTAKDKYNTPTAKESNFKCPTKEETPKTPKTPKTSKTPRTPKSQKTKTDLIEQEIPEHVPLNKYGFLKSLDVMVPISRCHPDAIIYRENYKSRKEELSHRLYKLYNEKLFKNELNVQIIWNKKLVNTAGRCSNKKKGNLRSSVIELSEKVLTSGDRLRCTLIHELCHAATWIFNGEHGHGATWKAWAQKANFVFQELPKIGVCHSYDIEYKYTYKCKLCQAKSHAHSKSKKVEKIRCAYCHGAIEILLNKKDKDGNIISTPIKEPTGFAKFVKDNYKNFQKPELKHADVMKLLSTEFAALKVDNKK